MKREIKFRGKRTDNSEWVYGHLFQTPVGEWKLKKGFREYLVDHDTVCQFTGRTDIKGTEIYEGDYARYEHKTQNGRLDIGNSYEIQWNERDCAFCLWDGFTHIALPPFGSLRVIGNIYDNPQLLESNK